MSVISIVEARLPPGFRFHPRDDELVLDYLSKKAGGDGGHGSFYGSPMLIDIDLNKCEPWDLPEMACVGGKEWYFYSLRDRKYATGQRTNRATESGYWKATGKDRPVRRRGVLVGARKTLVFYQGRAPKGKKTGWIMHEFRREALRGCPPKLPFKEDWVLCRAFYKSRATTVSKPRMETCYNNTTSNSLPPLVERYITFDQAPRSFDGYEQVPCFSNSTPSSASLRQNTAAPVMSTAAEGSLSSKSSVDLEGFLDMPNYDKRGIRDVLNQFNRLEQGTVKTEFPPSLAQGGLLDCYFAENTLSQMWNPF